MFIFENIEIHSNTFTLLLNISVGFSHHRSRALVNCHRVSGNVAELFNLIYIVLTYFSSLHSTAKTKLFEGLAFDSLNLSLVRSRIVSPFPAASGARISRSSLSTLPQPRVNQLLSQFLLIMDSIFHLEKSTKGYKLFEKKID